MDNNETDYNFVGKPFTVYTDEHRKPNYKGQWNSYGVYDNVNDKRHYIEGWEANSWAEAARKANELNEQSDIIIP